VTSPTVQAPTIKPKNAATLGFIFLSLSISRINLDLKPNGVVLVEVVVQKLYHPVDSRMIDIATEFQISYYPRLLGYAVILSYNNVYLVGV
jgi:hypothetical protein